MKLPLLITTLAVLTFTALSQVLPGPFPARGSAASPSASSPQLSGPGPVCYVARQPLGLTSLGSLRPAEATFENAVTNGVKIP